MKENIDIILALTLAIENKKQVKIKYTPDSTYRLIEPFVLGQNGTGETILRAFDLGKEDWRLFKVSKITKIQNTDKSFMAYRGGYNYLTDKIIKKVLKRVK